MSSSEAQPGIVEEISCMSAIQIEQHPSSIYAVIPSVVRSRLPNLGSIRKSVRNTLVGAHTRTKSMPDLREQQLAVLRDSSTRDISPATSGTVTPVQPATPNSNDDNQDTNTLEFGQENLSLRVDHRSGAIDWETAEMGVRLWLNAYARVRNGESVDEKTLRSFHLDATRYMIMALPMNLTQLETDLLQETIKVHLSTSTANRQIVRQENKQNLLRSVTAQLVCMIITLVFFLIPLLMSLTNSALRFERRHRLTEHTIQGGKVLAQNLTSLGFELGGGFSRFTRSSFGVTCYKIFGWTMQSVLAGVNDGLLRSSNGNLQLLDYRFENFTE